MHCFFYRGFNNSHSTKRIHYINTPEQWIFSNVSIAVIYIDAFQTMEGVSYHRTTTKSPAYLDNTTRCSSCSPRFIFTIRFWRLSIFSTSPTTTEKSVYDLLTKCLIKTAINKIFMCLRTLRMRSTLTTRARLIRHGLLGSTSGAPSLYLFIYVLFIHFSLSYNTR